MSKGRTGRTARRGKTRGMIRGSHVTQKGCTQSDALESAIEYYVRVVGREVDREMQHGPVKILWKDGKPVQQ